MPEALPISDGTHSQRIPRAGGSLCFSEQSVSRTTLTDSKEAISRCLLLITDVPQFARAFDHSVFSEHFQMFLGERGEIIFRAYSDFARTSVLLLINAWKLVPDLGPSQRHPVHAQFGARQGDGDAII